MSKKSRRRNKKILAALALAGGAAMLGKRGVPAAANVDSGRGSGLRDTVDSAKNWITKKDVLPVSKPVVTGSYLGKMTGGDPNDPTGHIGQITRANAAKRMRKNAAMNYQRSQTFDARPRAVHTGNINQFDYRAKGGRIGAKKGGRVTGAAKRGFGRALMKGKK